MASSSKTDFFISRAGPDNKFAKWLGDALETGKIGKRYSVLLQDWHFLGHNFLTKMDRGVQQSDQLIVVLSSAYLKSAWTQIEWQAAVLDDIGNDRQRLVILKIDRCQPKGILALYAYTDLSTLLAEGSAVSNKVEADIVGLLKATLDPAERRVLTPLLSELVGQQSRIIDPTLRAPIGALPVEPAGPGLDALWSTAAATAAQARRLAIVRTTATPIAGDTIAEYALSQAVQERYGGVWRITGDSEANLCADLQRLATHIDPALADGDVAAGARAALRLIERGAAGRLLLVIENVADSRLLDQWLPRFGADIIVTTGLRGLAPADIPELTLRKLSVEAGAAFLRSSSGRDTIDVAELTAFVERIECDPFVLAVSARMLRGNELLDLRDLSTMLAAGADEFTRVRGTIEKAVTSARDPVAAMHLIGVLWWLGASAIPIERLAAAAGDASVKLNAGELLRLGLATRDEGARGLRLDGAVRALGKEWADPAGNARRAIQAWLQQDDATSDNVHQRLTEAYAAQAIEIGPLSEDWSLLNAGGTSLHARGLHAASAACFAAIAELARAEDPVDTEALAAALTSQAAALAADGKIADAMTVLEKVRSTSLLEPGSPQLAHLDLLQGSLWLARGNPGDLDLAEAGVDRAKAIFETLDTQDADVLAAIASAAQNLGACARERGQLEKALALQSEALELNLRASGERDVSYADASLARAETLQALGRQDDATTAYRDALEIYVAKLSPGHPKMERALKAFRVFQETSATGAI